MNLFSQIASASAEPTRRPLNLAFWREQSRIVLALILIDMRTRFGGSFLSYSIAILWPLIHVGVVTIGYILVNKVAPLGGGDPAIFIGCAILPYCLAFYPARMIGSAVFGGKMFLNFPIVAPMHLIVARIILEILAAIVVAMLFVAILSMAGTDVVPVNVNTALAAIGATIYFGVCIGIFMAMMMAVFGIFGSHAVIVSLILMYIASGSYVPLPLLPAKMKALGYYNPIFNLIEWLRMAYYVEYSDALVNKTMIFVVGGLLALIGLAGERFVRGRFVERI